MHKLYDEDDELRREFKDTFSGVHASEDLKARTLARMLDEENVEDKESGSSAAPAFRRRAVVFRPAVTAGLLCTAALVCVVLALFVFQGTPKPSYLTVMEDDVFYEEVMLKDGELHFVANRMAISIKPNAGGITIGQEADEASAAVEEGNETIEEKVLDEGGTLLFSKISAVELPDIGDKNWSYIGETQIYITKLNTSVPRYQAVFEKGGQAYEVTGTGVSQKAFIDYLYQIVKG
ncbi:MAG: hypothetical protein NC429_05950 [Lachnospiraceae bacterium]|nr:hypothetical protein [Lachnospiraceae bacterium]